MGIFHIGWKKSPVRRVEKTSCVPNIEDGFRMFLEYPLGVKRGLPISMPIFDGYLPATSGDTVLGINLICS